MTSYEIILEQKRIFEEKEDAIRKAERERLLPSRKERFLKKFSETKPITSNYT